MKRLGEVMDEATRGCLLAWLRAHAEETARELRQAGWEEDERGLWSRGRHRGLHIFDATEVERETGGES